MQDIRLEIYGKIQLATLDQLRTLALSNFLPPDTRVWVDGIETRVSVLLPQLNAGALKLNVPQGETSVSATPPPLSVNPDPFPKEKIDFWGAPETAPKWIKIMCVVSFFLVIGAIVYLIYVSVADTGKVAEEVPAIEQKVDEAQADEDENDTEGSQDSPKADLSSTLNLPKKPSTSPMASTATNDDASTNRNAASVLDSNEAPFNPEITRLPKGFQGNDYDKLVAGVAARRSEILKTYRKDEYETTNEYEERVAEEIKANAQTLITGKVRFGDHVAFLLNQLDDQHTHLQGKYDADKRLWSFACSFAGPNYSSDSIRTNQQGVPRECSFCPLKSESSIATERIEEMLDVRFRLKSYEKLWFGLYVEGESYNVQSLNSFNRVVFSNVPAAVAKEKANSVRWLIVCKTRYAPIETFTDSRRETWARYDDPSVALACEDLELWIYDESTGDVWAKVPIKDLFYVPVIIPFATPVGSSNVGAEASKNEASESETQETFERKFSSTPFNTNIAKLPKDYWGHDLDEIDNALEDASFATNSNGVALTSKEYSQRTVRQAKTLLNNPLYGSVKFGSRLAYVIPNASDNIKELGRKLETVRCGYEASTRTLTVTKSEHFLPSKDKFTMGTYPPNAVYFSLMKQEGSQYRRVSSFYRSREEITYALELPFKQVNKRGTTNHSSWTIIDVDGKDYEAFKDSIRVLCLYRLGHAGNKRLGIFDPTYASLNDKSPYVLFCAAEPEFWIYDSKTGMVLAKFSATDMFNSIRKKMGDMEPSGAKSDADDGAMADELNDASLFAAAPTWDDVVASIPNVAQSWESKEPTITIPDDYASLDEALAKSKKGDVIRIRKGATVKLRNRQLARGEEATLKIDHAVAIVGETEDPEDATIQLIPADMLLIDSPELVAFKGVTFRSDVGSSSGTYTAEVCVAASSKAYFKNCAFIGDLTSEKSTGALVEGANASAIFWRCFFSSFGREGIQTSGGAVVKAEYCEFFGKNRYGVQALDKGKIELTSCRFNENVTGLNASGGGSYVVGKSFFSKNRSEWSATTGASDCMTEGNIIEK